MTQLLLGMSFQMSLGRRYATSLRLKLRDFRLINYIQLLGRREVGIGVTQFDIVKGVSIYVLLDEKRFQ